jgi:hypothetical protein
MMDWSVNSRHDQSTKSSYAEKQYCLTPEKQLYNKYFSKKKTLQSQNQELDINDT